MRILYGVVGEGMGHAIRSRVVLDHLLAQGHQTEIMASARAAEYLAQRFAEVHRIHGLHIIYEQNRVRHGKTLWSNVQSGTAALPRQIAAYFKLIEDFEPEAVISDFESWTYLYAKLHRLPILSIDNMQILNRCRHPREILRGIRPQLALTRAFVKSKLPFCSHYLIATFFRPPLRRARTTLVPPILRPEILAAHPSNGEHLLVYQTAEGHSSLPRALAGLGLPCRVYGLRREQKSDQREGALLYRPFDERVFIEDLATARAVVSGGSFTLMSECVYLHKPMLAIPVRGQVEQVLNARYLQHEGYGLTADAVDAAQLERFLHALPQLEQRLASYAQDGNRETFDALDAWLDRTRARRRGRRASRQRARQRQPT
jgi:uncharacterized protein (TIGR00661 family)